VIQNSHLAGLAWCRGTHKTVPRADTRMTHCFWRSTISCTPNVYGLWARNDQEDVENGGLIGATAEGGGRTWIYEEEELQISQRIKGWRCKWEPFAAETETFSECAGLPESLRFKRQRWRCAEPETKHLRNHMVCVRPSTTLGIPTPN
jgi:hypothetical protein